MEYNSGFKGLNHLTCRRFCPLRCRSSPSCILVSARRC